MRRVIIFFCLQLSLSGLLLAQKTICPCLNCPDQIADGVEGLVGLEQGTRQSTQDFRVNIFNVLNNQLSNNGQCVKEVWIKFKHDFLGDVEMFLISPDGQEIQLIGPLSAGFGGTQRTTFDISFVRSSALANPEDNLEKIWHNEQDWAVFGTRQGSYFPYFGKLEDFNQGRVNGTWTLRVHDSEPDGNDTGELLDFGIEFCDPIGLVCDPCEEEKEQGIPCIFQLEGSKEQITPIEFVCVDIVAQNVAFVKTMEWTMSWDPTVITDAFVQNLHPNIHEFSNSDFQINNTTGNIQLNYDLPAIDSLGVVVADSSLLFQVCFNGAGEEGDTTVFAFDNLQVIDIEENLLPSDFSNGSVELEVDLSADCATAKQLCGKEDIMVESTKGPGNEKNEGDKNCWGEEAETQSKWYRFDVLETGTFDFMIQPLQAAGFRYTLFKDNCGGEVVECFSGRQNDDTPIGNSSDPMTVFGSNGKFGESIQVQKGTTYFLVIDNKDNNNAGFNLTFGGTCELGDETLVAAIQTPPILNCEQDTIVLNTSTTSVGDQYEYSWKIDGGNFIDTSNLLAPILDASGFYTLQVADTKTKCTTTASTTVDDDFFFPIAEAGDPFTLSCTDPTYQLDGTSSSLGNIFVYQWSSFDGGNIIEGEASSNAIINRPGSYVLAVTDTTNQCTRRDTVVISESVDIPNLEVDSSRISCTISTVEVQATSSTGGVEISWLGEDLVEPFIGDDYTANIPGTYTVTATAPNGCTKEKEVLITDDRIYPTARAGSDFTLSCATPVYTIAPDSSSTGDDFQYEWRTSDGHFVDDNQLTELTPSVDSAGTYILNIKDTSNGCSIEDTVLIQKNFLLPTIGINSPTLLTCFEEFIVLDASQSDTGTLFNFEWIIEDEGNISSGMETYRPTIDKGGTYIFSVTNKETGCNNQDTVFISESQDKPNLNVVDGTISCTVPTIIISAQSDTLGVTYEWTSVLLNTPQAGDSLLINKPGAYQVTALAPNGCRTQQSVEIADDRLAPNLELPTNDTLTCTIVGLDLVANSSTTNTSFLWIPPSGDSVFMAEILAVEPGIYKHIATASNGCTTTDSIQIFNDQNAPVAAIEPPSPLTCDSAFIQLDASINSSKGNQFSYTWTTADGQFEAASNLNTTQIGVQEAGIYQLSVYDDSNDCETKTSIEVKDIREFPTILLTKPKVDTLNCLDSVLLYQVNSNATTPQYEWTFKNNLVSSSDTLAIQQSGSYQLSLLDLENNCLSTEELTIVIDTLSPIANAGPPQTLNCLVGSVQLDGSRSSQGQEFSYLWTSEIGATISADISTEVSEKGTYTLKVINTNSGCRTQAEVAIAAALDNPDAQAGADTVLCRGNERPFEIGTSFTSQGDQFIYSWYTLTGDSLGTAIKQTVDSEGQFILKVTNVSNQCEAVDTIEVIERARPNITVDEVGGINCKDNLVTFIARSDMPNTTISWDGQEVFNDTIFSATDAIEGATYIAYGINEETGCDNFSRSVTIVADRNPPIVNPGSNAILNCLDTLLLDGTLSQQEAHFEYTWSTENGRIIGATDSLVAMVNEPGTYQLSIFNTQNFCSNEDTLVVTDNRMNPAIQLPAVQVLTCSDTTINLGNDTFPSSATLFYNWRNTAGDPLGKAPTLLNIEQSGTYILEVIDSFNLCRTIDSTEVIEEKTLPQITLDSTKELDCTTETTTLTASVNIEGIYKWTTQEGNIRHGENTLTPMINAGGTYLLSIENEETGCVATASIEVVDNHNSSQIDAGQATAITCYNDSLVTLIGNLQSEETNLLFEWTAAMNPTVPISDSLTVSVGQPGTYYLKATNPVTSCINLDSVVVSNNIQPISFTLPTTYPKIDCRAPDLEIGLTDFPITDSIVYKWTSERGTFMGATDQPTATILKAGTYQLEIVNTLNGCSNTSQVDIEADGELPIVDVGVDQFITCDNPTIQIGTTNTSSGPNFSYEWTRADGTPIPNNEDQLLMIEEAGTYQLVVENLASGCTESAVVVISKKVNIDGLTFPNNSILDCIDTLITLVINSNKEDSLTYQWTATEGIFIANSTTAEIAVNQPGTYQILVKDPFSGCEKEANILVEDKQQSPPIDLGEDQLLRCDEPIITLKNQIAIEGKHEFVWTNGAGNTIARTPTTSVSQVGNYELKITNQDNGCEAIDTIVIEANTAPPRGAIYDVIHPSCEDSRNASVRLREIIGGQAPYDIQLNEQAITEEDIFDNLLAGEYQLTIADALACTWDTTILIEAPAALEVEILSSATQLETGDIVQLSIDGPVDPTTIAIINWQPEALFSCSDCLDQTLTLLNDTEIAVAIIDENGCEGFASQFIEVQLAEMPNAITPNGDGSNDFFRIPAIEAAPDNYPDNELIIFNRWGDIVYSASPYRNDWDGSQHGQALPEGTYYYVLRLDVSEGVTMKGMVTVLR